MYSPTWINFDPGSILMQDQRFWIKQIVNQTGIKIVYDIEGSKTR